MIRLGGLVIGVWLVSAVGVSGAMLLGRGRIDTNSIQSYRFNLCDNKPCFMGVTIGMAWDEARAALSKGSSLIEFADMGKSIFVASNAHIDAGVKANARGTRVAEILFGVVPEEDFPSVGSIIGLYGPPCKVVLSSFQAQFDRISLRYPHLVLELRLVENRVSPYSRVYTFQLYDPVNSFDYCHYRGLKLVVNKWSGFKSIDHYKIDQSTEP